MVNTLNLKYLRKFEEKQGKRYVSFLIISFLSVFISSDASLQMKKIEVKISRHLEPDNLVGLTFAEERDSPLFYDTFYPVIFEMKVPNWTVADLKVEVPKNISLQYQGTKEENGHLCTKPMPSTVSRYQPVSTTSAPSSPFLPTLTSPVFQPFGFNGTYNDLWETTLCPIKYKLDELLEQLASEMKAFETYNASLFRLDSHFTSCHDIKPHFSNHIIDDLELELYLVQIVLDCPITDILHTRLTISEPKKQLYDEIFQLFLETYIMPRFRLIGFPKFAIPTNTLLTLHTTRLVNYLLDSFQWTTAINTCNSQRIPRLLIPQEELSRVLEDILIKLGGADLNLTIPITDISNYYKLKLADCVTTTSGTYIVRILVPLQRISANYRLVTVKSIPFINKDTASSRITICHHRTTEGTYIVEGQDVTNTKPVSTTTCQSAELCRVPPPGERSLFPKCLRVSLLNDTEPMLDSCRMTCVQHEPDELPYIKRIRSDQFVIAGNVSSKDISVICGKDKDKPIPVEGVPVDIGSMLITIPCNCYLVHGSYKYEVNGPCEFNLDFRPVRPKGYSYDALLDHYFHHRLQNISHTIANSLMNHSNNGTLARALLFDDSSINGGDDDGQSNEGTQCPSWPLYLGLFLILCIIGFLAFGFFVLRNIYVRVGQVEMSAALAPGSGITTSRRYQNGPVYSRNAPVTFRVTDNNSYLSDNVY